MDNPRIGLLGTCCTGKSTLMTLLTIGSGLPGIHEDARELYEEHMKDATWNRDDPHMQLALQYEIFSSKFRREMNAFQKGFIADRTYLDNYMYYLYYSHRVVNKEECLFFEKMCKDAMAIYTHIFVLSLDDIPYINDSVRTENYCTSLFYETSMIGLIQRWGLNVHYVPANTEADRAKSSDFICDIADLPSTEEKYAQENRALKATYESLKDTVPQRPSLTKKDFLKE